MCGIIGLLVKRDELQDQLGSMVTPMIRCMATRGPDSAGMAVFRSPLQGERRFGLFTDEVGFSWPELLTVFERECDANGQITSIESHCMLTSPVEVEQFKSWLRNRYPHIHLLSVGRAIEMYKDEGLPSDIAERYRFADLAGTHIVGHTRMATESAISPAHAHPYTAGEDFCLVHNGSLSNPYSVRRKLERRGIEFVTDNDTEAGCRFLEWRMREGDALEQAIERAFEELDGFFTFLMATHDKMVLVRDAFACKPAVVAETDDYVAVSSEYRSLAHLPQIAEARVYEPAPEQIYSWNVHAN